MFEVFGSYALGLCMVCSFLEGLGFFRAAWGGQDFSRFSGVACEMVQSECFSHVYMGSWSLMYSLPGGVGFACVALAIIGLLGARSPSVLYSAKVCKLIEVMVVTVIIYCDQTPLDRMTSMFDGFRAGVLGT